MYVILICYILTVGFFYRIFFGQYKNLNLFHLFYLSYVVCILVALPRLNNGEVYYSIYIKAALLTPIFFLIGGIVGKIRFFPIINSGQNYKKGEYFLQKRVNKILKIFIVFILLYIFDVGINNSGLLFAIVNPGNFTDAMEMRMSALTSNITPLLTKLYGYSRAFIIPFLSCLFLVFYLEKKITTRKFLIIFLFSVFYCAFSAAKAPVFYLILTMGLTYYWWYLNFNPRLAYMYLFKFLSIIMVGLISASLFYPLLHGVSGEEGIIYAWDQLNERVFVVPSSVALKYFEIFGRSIDFLGIKGNAALSLILGEEKISSAQLLYSYFYSNRFSDRGLMNAAFFASMYADFGFFSIILGVTFCGFIVAQVQNFLNMLPFGAISLSCKAICGLAVMQLALTDFTSILVGRGLLLLPFLLFIFVYVVRILENKFRY